MQNYWGTKKPNLHFNLDTDKDGILDYKDCQPFNRNKQHSDDNICRRIGGFVEGGVCIIRKMYLDRNEGMAKELGATPTLRKMTQEESFEKFGVKGAGKPVVHMKAYEIPLDTLHGTSYDIIEPLVKQSTLRNRGREEWRHRYATRGEEYRQHLRDLNKDYYGRMSEEEHQEFLGKQRENEKIVRHTYSPEEYDIWCKDVRRKAQKHRDTRTPKQRAVKSQRRINARLLKKIVEE